MWLLLIVLINVVPGLACCTVLKQFAKAEDCQTERNRIGFEMAESYPYEHDFNIVCEYQAKGI